jgi:hypothetical protein
MRNALTAAWRIQRAIAGGKKVNHLISPLSFKLRNSHQIFRLSAELNDWNLRRSLEKRRAQSREGQCSAAGPETSGNANGHTKAEELCRKLGADAERSFCFLLSAGGDRPQERSNWPIFPLLVTTKRACLPSAWHAQSYIDGISIKL